MGRAVKKGTVRSVREVTEERVGWGGGGVARVVGSCSWR